jgi:hypothetical protein
MHVVGAEQMQGMEDNVHKANGTGKLEDPVIYARDDQ